MPAYVALLRGVNVGKARRVAMAEWRAQLEALGYGDVRTLLNSGNAVFTAPRAASRSYADAIAAALERGLKLSARVVVKSSSEFEAVVRENPFARIAEDHSRLLVAFTQEATDLKSLASLASLAGTDEKFAIGKNAAYVYFPGGLLQSKAGAALLGKAGELATTRNWATTLKLQALLEETRRGAPASSR